MFESEEKKEKIHERPPSEGQKCRGRAATPCDNDNIFHRLHKETQWGFFSLLYSLSDCFSSVSGKDKTSSRTFETLLRSKVVRYATVDANIFVG